MSIKGHRPIRAFLAALFFVAAAFLMVGLAAQYLETRVSAEAQCQLAPPADASLTEQALTHAEASAWPIGRRCTWLLADGSTATIHSSWTITFLTAGATAVCLLLAMWAGGLAYRTRDRMMWVLALVSVFTPVLTWVILGWVASAFQYATAM